MQKSDIFPAEGRQAGPDLTRIYDKNFHHGHIDASLQSARIYLKYFWQFFQPDSVLDVGCGRGAWLKACHELGSNTLIGFDGGWNDQSSMIDDAICFQTVNLNEPFSIPQKVDLAMTLEVAEHLDPATAPQFVNCLADAADVVLFSAAYKNQGGTYHINEQPHSFWAHLFAKHDFVPFDLFRPVFWGNEDISYWYRQNVFLYLEKNSAACQKLRAHGFSEIADVSFMNCIHPQLYDRKNIPPSVLSHVRDFVPSLRRALRRRVS